MPVPAGTATPWRELTNDESGDTLVYLRDGDETGSADLLAEALRIDGVVRSLGVAIKAAESATLDHGWCGFLDDGTEVLCDSTGETTLGEYVDNRRECVVALVKLVD